MRLAQDVLKNREVNYQAAPCLKIYGLLFVVFFSEAFNKALYVKYITFKEC